MVDNHKKSISWGFILASLLSVAIMALFFFAVPIFTGNPSVVGAYSSGGEDSATGLGTSILPKGTWFMYNVYDGSTSTYDIEAGNPKNGENIIGSYTVANNGDSTYTVTYDINEGITVVDEHLGISNSANFTASPGTDDNQNFGEAFSDGDGSFFIFAHFGVEY
ncbi:MAG: hypothetical protein WCD72_01950 [Dehalococcoidia bacterium]